MAIETLSAITLFTHDMERALAFYQALGFRKVWAQRDNAFVVINAGAAWVNLQLVPPEQTWGWWGRFIFHVDDVDAHYDRAVAAGYHPEAAPSDAPWGERYFQVLDPDGHEVSIAKRLRPASAPRPV